MPFLPTGSDRMALVELLAREPPPQDLGHLQVDRVRSVQRFAGSRDSLGDAPPLSATRRTSRTTEALSTITADFARRAPPPRAPIGPLGKLRER
jgi:hypothetical protein